MACATPLLLTNAHPHNPRLGACCAWDRKGSDRIGDGPASEIGVGQPLPTEGGIWPVAGYKANSVAEREQLVLDGID